MFCVGCCCSCSLFWLVGCWWNFPFTFKLRYRWCVSLTVLRIVPLQSWCVEHSCASAISLIHCLKSAFVSCWIRRRKTNWFHLNFLLCCWDQLWNLVLSVYLSCFLWKWRNLQLSKEEMSLVVCSWWISRKPVSTRFLYFCTSVRCSQILQLLFSLLQSEVLADLLVRSGHR